MIDWALQGPFEVLFWIKSNLLWSLTRISPEFLAPSLRSAMQLILISLQLLVLYYIFFLFHVWGVTWLFEAFSIFFYFGWFITFRQSISYDDTRSKGVYLFTSGVLPHIWGRPCGRKVANGLRITKLTKIVCLLQDN